LHCNGEVKEGGEESMVEETIKAIRETEEAGEKSQKILEDARQEAERMIKSQEETHRISAQDAMQDAREKARVFQEEARVQTEKEIKVLKEFAVQKEAEAVSAVISQLVL
jgi:vacuolar-type H+-ATPase subunit H